MGKFRKNTDKINYTSAINKVSCSVQCNSLLTHPAADMVCKLSCTVQLRLESATSLECLV